MGRSGIPVAADGLNGRMLDGVPKLLATWNTGSEAVELSFGRVIHTITMMIL
jgi:hypothetical protein